MLNYCVVIPTYNNASTLRVVIEGVLRQCSNVIVVNDGSTDSTAEILQSLGERIVVVAYLQNRGKGYALVQGFRKAQALGYTHAVTIDADGQHFPEDIPLLLKAADASSEAIVVGCRNLSEENMPSQNTFANRFSNFWFHLQTGIALADTQSGYRLYPLAALHGLRYITSRYEAELELLVFAAWSGTDIISVPVRVYYPPREERVSHFRPGYDFFRISVLNTILCLGALFYGVPRQLFRVLGRKLK